MVLSIISFYLLLVILDHELSHEPIPMLYALWQEAKVLLYLLLPVLYIEDIAQFRRTLGILAFIAGVACFTAITASAGLIHIDYAVAESRLNIGLIRTAGVVGTFGSLTALVVTALMASFTLAQQPRGTLLRRRYIRWLLYLILLLGMLAAQSRNMILSAGLAITCYYFLLSVSVRGRMILVLYAFGLLLATLFLVFFGLPLLQHAYNTIIGTGSMQGSALDRLMSYKATWNLIVKEPWLGPKTLSPIMYDQIERTIHNFWLGILFKGGILGFIPIATLFCISLYGSLRSSQSTTIRSEAIAMISLTLSLMFSSFFYVAQNTLLFWLCIGITLSLNGLSINIKSSPTNGGDKKVVNSSLFWRNGVIPRRRLHNP